MGLRGRGGYQRVGLRGHQSGVAVTMACPYLHLYAPDHATPLSTRHASPYRPIIPTLVAVNLRHQAASGSGLTCNVLPYANIKLNGEAIQPAANSCRLSLVLSRALDEVPT